jgi:Transposase zinc-binding domain
MVEIADIFRIHGPDYRAQCGDRMLPSHLRAMHDIAQGRTEALGGPLYDCDTCRDDHDRYHSCQNRPGPKCQNGQAHAWLENPQSLLRPVTHVMVTFTRPAELSAVARSHQKTLDNILFRSSSEA